MNQSEFLEITCNLLKAQEKSGAIGFGFASLWLKNLRETFKPITKRSSRNRVITFDSHLETALLCTQDGRITISSVMIYDLLGNLSNHDDDGNKNVTNLHI